MGAAGHAGEPALLASKAAARQAARKEHSTQLVLSTSCPAPLQARRWRTSQRTHWKMPASWSRPTPSRRAQRAAVRADGCCLPGAADAGARLQPGRDRPDWLVHPPTPRCACFAPTSRWPCSTLSGKQNEQPGHRVHPGKQPEEERGHGGGAGERLGERGNRQLAGKRRASWAAPRQGSKRECAFRFPWLSCLRVLGRRPAGPAAGASYTPPARLALRVSPRP